MMDENAEARPYDAAMLWNSDAEDENERQNEGRRERRVRHCVCICNPICRGKSCDWVIGMAFGLVCFIALLPVFAGVGIIAIPIYVGVHFIKERIPSSECCACF